mmetsp:Transcript_6197/g.20094  ORF Transcript_6197/g.20094 Transcript_6197/m.20094 type:complete len:528 (-) Transcript_6197:194-1777(-)|eukprot:CAMPEP_0202082166 /NCGR_PEP_ID=MMETSP0964-20121228/17953_1 /ASSEMBLY_ACC=CAM_ASM_000500 /TAXON_ID=4773 /ORGANISM="Schizochytrium aggregatum, Strain ATCC28209" /LENGTH=527 /DNA_ID=CAMNT_0048649789 /DNA_START=42 /DNA_END=1625 /DNA_ORIENTATION=+
MAPPPPSPSVLIVGAGMSGLRLAIKLRDRGHDAVTVLEQAAGLGGTWRANAYPGCCCDVPSYAYLPLELLPGFVPERKFSTQAEILDFLERVADHHKVRDCIQFNARVTDAAWDGKQSCWVVRTEQGQKLTPRYLVFANGPLSRPKLASVPGLDSFEGASWHTAHWERATPVQGKRVAVIGTGASAIQVIPELAKEAKELIVFQRSAAYCFPRDDVNLAEGEPENVRRLREEGKQFAEKLRAFYSDYYDDTVFQIYNEPDVNEKAQQIHNQLLRKIVRDPLTAQQLTPNYPQGCKRVLVSDNYFQTFNQPNVSLVASAVDRVGQHRVTTVDGRDFDDIDVIVVATGFSTGPIEDVNIKGRGGVTLAESYKGGIHTMFGLMSSGFPNLFMMLGPHSWTPQGNTAEAIAVQSSWIVHVMDHIERSTGAAVIEPNHAAEDYWAMRCASVATSAVWLKCASWYTDSSGKPLMWMGEWYAYANELWQGDLARLLCANDMHGAKVQLSRAEPLHLSLSELPLRKRVPLDASRL